MYLNKKIKKKLRHNKVTYTENEFFLQNENAKQ